MLLVIILKSQNLNYYIKKLLDILQAFVSTGNSVVVIEHNLDVIKSADWIVDFCKRNNTRVCLDISHSILQCNYMKESSTLFLEKVLPFTAHLHLADGAGVDGEGLQINDGDVDFHLMAEKVKELCPTATWIPEIWQGHEEDGKAFWIALDRLEAAGF